MKPKEPGADGLGPRLAGENWEGDDDEPFTPFS